MAKKNYYEVLGVSQTATQEEIKKAYRNQSKLWHPDVNSDSNAENVMKVLNIAYEILSDLSLRQKYDAKLREENRISSSATKSQQTARQYSYYTSYTKTREESEYDFDEWLKDYLRRERKKYTAAEKENFINIDIEILNLLKKLILLSYRNQKKNVSFECFDQLNYDFDEVEKIKYKKVTRR